MSMRDESKNPISLISEPTEKTLADFKWVPFGDSLTDITNTAGETYDDGKRDKGVGWKYHDVIREATGITVYNYSDKTAEHKARKNNAEFICMGYGGSGYHTNGSGVGGDTCFYRRMESVPTDADVITIFGSVNDWKWRQRGLSIGTVNDTLENGTYAGYVNKCIDVAVSRCPNAKIILIGTPYFTNGVNNADWRAATAMNQSIASARGIPFYDLFFDQYSGSEVNNPWAELEVIFRYNNTGTYYKVKARSLNYMKWNSTLWRDVYATDMASSGHPDNLYNRLYIAPKIASILCTELGVSLDTLPASLRCNPPTEVEEPATCVGIDATYKGGKSAGDSISKDDFIVYSKWSDGSRRLVKPYEVGMTYHDTMTDSIYVGNQDRQDGVDSVTLTSGVNTIYIYYGHSSRFYSRRTTVLVDTEKTTYTATFKADGTIVDTVEFEAGASVLPRVPAVPVKTGYTGAWEQYTLADADITINAVYTPIEWVPTGYALGSNGPVMSGLTANNVVVYGGLNHRNQYLEFRKQE